MSIENFENIESTPEPIKARTFTQDEVNKFLADERRKAEKKFSAKAKAQQLNHDLERAATLANSNSPGVITALLKQHAITIEKQDAAGGTGEWETLIDLPDIDEDTGEQVVTRMTPTAAVKRMPKIPEYMPLFKSNVVSGLGAANSGGVQQPRQIDAARLTTEQYMEMRNQPGGRKRLGLSNQPTRR